MSRTLLSLALLVGFAVSPARADEAADLAAFAKSVKGEFTDIEQYRTRTLTLKLPATATDADLAALAKLAPQLLNRLDLRDCDKLTDAGFLALKGMPNLSHTYIPAGLTDKAVEGLAERLPGLTSVTVWGLGGKPSRLTNAGVESIATLKSLHHFSLYNVTAADDGIWAALKEAAALKSFNAVSCPKLTGAGIKRLGDCRMLRQLDLFGCPLTEAGATEIGELNSLRDLSLIRCGVTDKAAAAYAKLTALESLTVMSNPITDAAVEPLVGLEKLSRLTFYRVPITDATLASLVKLKALENLSVDGTKITEAGLAAFRKARPEVAVESKRDQPE